MNEEWSEDKIRECNDDMAAAALDAIHQLLDSGGIPRGTFADDHVSNLVALYNRRGDALKDIASTAQAASQAAPEQFPEWAFNRVAEVFSYEENATKG